jgi:predicted DNA-binding transcriptional regulator YafY
VWYLIARLSDELEMRSFRVERMRAVDELPTRFERPPEFDLERYWSDTSAQFKQTSPEYFVTLRTAIDAIDRVTLYWTAEVLESDAGYGVVRVAFPGPEAAAYQVLAWGSNVTVVEPLELRASIVERAREALERHAP